MQNIATQSSDYAQAIADLVAAMPVDRAAQVYDFARFLQSQPLLAPPDDADNDWLNDSEEQMQAEDARWDAAFARHRDKFAVLAKAARAEIAEGMTLPMFDERGEFAADEIAHYP